MKRPAANGHSLRARLIWGAKLGSVMTLAALGACADMPVFHTPATMIGFATTPREGQDFIKETRPEKMEFTPVGVETGHPPEKPRDAAGVKQLQAELEAQRATGHAIMQTLAAPQPASPAPAAPTPEDKAKAKSASKAKPKTETAEKPKKPAPDEAPAPQ